jgi:serine/threonine protein kinase
MEYKCFRKKEFWLISPLCSKGDLYNVLKDDHGLRLNAVKRVKILLQVALAIEYIHTAVPGVR